MRKAFKYRLWTNANQERELSTALESHRRLYNNCLAQRIDAYQRDKTQISYSDQSGWHRLERKANPYFARLNFSSAQATMRRLDVTDPNIDAMVNGFVQAAVFSTDVKAKLYAAGMQTLSRAEVLWGVGTVASNGDVSFALRGIR